MRSVRSAAAASASASLKRQSTIDVAMASTPVSKAKANSAGDPVKSATAIDEAQNTSAEMKPQNVMQYAS